MTVDDLVLKLHDLQNQGKGRLRVVLDDVGHYEWDVRTARELELVTVQLKPSEVDRHRPPIEHGQFIDGRGRPRGTERVVRIL